MSYNSIVAWMDIVGGLNCPVYWTFVRSYIKSISIRKLVQHFIGIDALLLLRVGAQIAQFLFNRSHNFEFGCGPEIEALLADQWFEVSGNITSSNIHTHYAVRHGESFVNRHSMCDTIAWIQYHAGNTSGCVSVEGLIQCMIGFWQVERHHLSVCWQHLQTKYGLHRHKPGGHIECFKEDFSGFLAVLSWI